MSTADIPERWARRIMQRGYKRTRGSGPNLSAFAKDIGIHTSTLTNALRGGPRAPEAGTIAKIVGALGPDTAAWFGVERVEPWEPPASSALLTDRQRKALTELIESMTERGEDRDARSPSMNRAGESPATEDDQAQFGLAAMAGEPGNPPDTTTGEESQVPPETEEWRPDGEGGFRRGDYRVIPHQDRWKAGRVEGGFVKRTFESAEEAIEYMNSRYFD